MANQQTLGDHGEALAAEYLQGNGYNILHTNWSCRYGEVDLIAQKHETLVFVEVKTRRAQTTESAFASITPTKQKRFIAAVHEYLNENADEDVIWRIDAIAIALPTNGAPIIDHQEDALGW